MSIFPLGPSPPGWLPIPTSEPADEEWPSVAAYRQRLAELGSQRTLDRKAIPGHVKARVRSVRVTLSFVGMLVSWFSCVLVTSIVHPTFYWREKSMELNMVSPFCEVPPRPSAGSAPLDLLRAESNNLVTGAMAPYIWFDGWDHVDVIRITVAENSTSSDVPHLLSTKGVVGDAPMALLRFLSLGVFWPIVVNVRMTPDNECVRSRVWPHRVEMVAHFVASTPRGSRRLRGVLRGADGRDYTCSGVDLRSSAIARATVEAVGRPVGATSPGALVCTSGGVSGPRPSLVGFIIFSLVLSALLVVYGKRRAGVHIRRWRIAYANRVAPEYSYNFHAVQDGGGGGDGGSTTSGSEATGGKEADDGVESDELQSEAQINAQLRGHFEDEFSDMQIVEFALPNSTPVECDRSLKHGVPATLLHLALALVPQAPLLFGAYLLGCHAGLRDFPHEEEQRCKVGDGAFAAPFVIVLLLAVQALTHFVYATAYYTNAPLAARRPLRMVAQGCWTAVVFVCLVYVAMTLLWLLLGMMVKPWSALSWLILLATIATYTFVILLGLIKTIQLSYDHRGRLRRQLVEKGGVPESKVVSVALSGVLIVLALGGWLGWGYFLVGSNNDIGKLFTSLIGGILVLVRGVSGIQNATKGIQRDVFGKVHNKIESLKHLPVTSTLAEPTILGEVTAASGALSASKRVAPAPDETE